MTICFLSRPHKLFPVKLVILQHIACLHQMHCVLGQQHTLNMTSLDEAELQEFEEQLKWESLEKSGKLQEGATKTRTDPDGTIFEWDEEKKAWFPKVTEDMIAQYQAASYSFPEPTPSDDTQSSDNKEPSESAVNQANISCQNGSDDKEPDVSAASEAAATAALKRKKKDPPTWFDASDDKNTNVYVTGLPEDIDEDEFLQLMHKCGLIMADLDTGKLKVKLYKNQDGKNKGDALCCYLKKESVDLAVQLLDESQYKGRTITVEPAKFELKGAYNPALKKKKKKQDKKKMERQQRLLEWKPEPLRGARKKSDNTIIIKNMFDPKEFMKDAPLILEYQRDLRDECSKFGEVKKVTVFDTNPDGVASVVFKEVEAADLAVQSLHGRWFAQRQLLVETWDGKTKYRVEETEEEHEARLKKWHEDLEADDSDEEQPQSTATNTAGQPS